MPDQKLESLLLISLLDGSVEMEFGEVKEGVRIILISRETQEMEGTGGVGRL
jgi:hypothetical protein